MLLLFHFSFGRRAHADDCNAAAQFGEALLQFLLVVIAGALVDLSADFLDAAFNTALGALAADDGCVLFIGDYFLGAAKVLNGRGLKLAAGLFGNHSAAGQDSDILQHGFSAITKTRSFNSNDIQHAA